MRSFLCTLIYLALQTAGLGLASDMNFTSPITQSAFHDLSREAGAAFAYRNLAMPKPLGVPGFDAAAQVSVVDISGGSYWQDAFTGDAPDFLLIPQLRLRAGLPFAIDLGAMYAAVPDSNITLYGFEVAKALLTGGAGLPALGIRATYSRLSGVDDLDLQTVGVDASVSVALLFLTPYAGIGALWVDSSAQGGLQGLSQLSGEQLWLPRIFAGVKLVPFPFLGITAELEYTERMIYSLKAAVNF